MKSKGPYNFAFVGWEYPLPIEGTEEYIDLLFYHLNLHCYVVVEVKVKEFKSRDVGQIGTYINIVDDIVRTDADGKTIGLIICKEKNNEWKRISLEITYVYGRGGWTKLFLIPKWWCGWKSTKCGILNQ